MKTLCMALLSAAAALASVPAGAEEAIGRVRAVYAEVARGVMMDPRLGRASASATRWADVEIGGGTGEPRRVLVQMSPALEASPGDLVTVQLEDRLPARLAAEQLPMLRVSRITEVRTRAFAGIGDAPGAPRSSIPAR